MDALLRSLEGSDAALVVATHDPTVAQRLTQVWLMDHGVLTLPVGHGVPARAALGSTA